MSYERLRIAVTGGSGVVGRSVIRYLAERGHSLINIDQRACPDLPARFVFMDLRKRELLQPVLEQVDVVLHLGEIPHAGRFSDEYTYGHNTTVGATVLTTAADLKLRHVVYTSTCQIYGAWGRPVVPPVRLPVDEDHPPQPANAYSLSKTANEGYCRFVANDKELRVSIFRLPWVIPAGAEARMVRWLMRDSHPIERDGAGTYLHASDIGPAFEAAVLLNREGCHVYNLSAPDAMMRQPVAEQIQRQYPDWPSLPDNWPAHGSILVTDRARQTLGWEAKWTIRTQYEQLTGDPWQD